MRIVNKLFLLFMIMNITSFGGYIPFIDAQQQKILQVNIDEISRLALQNNFDIQVYRLDQSISEKELLKAHSVYDTEINASYKYDKDKLKRSSTITGNETISVTQNIDLARKLPSGTILSLGISHEKETTDSTFATLNPYHESEASISITQPFGKNALGIINRNDIKITKLDIENTGYTSTDKIEQELSDVQKAYWNLLLANKQMNLTEELLKSAENLYTSSKKNFDIGIVESPEFYAVNANLKEKEKDVLLARDNLNTASNLMRLKLNIVDKDIRIEPTDEFDCENLDYAFEDIIQIALIKRRDYAAAKNDVRAMNLYIEMKKNSLWPEIDLKGTFKKNGLDKKFSTSIREISSEDYPEYTVEITFSFPLENSAARAEYSQKELEKTKALVNLKKTECLILVQIHDAFVHAKSIYDSVKLLKQAMDLQHKKFLGEEDRFRKARSDTDRLIRYQNDYLNAKLNYLNSLYRYKAALIDLKLAMNILLGEIER